MQLSKHIERIPMFFFFNQFSISVIRDVLDSDVPTKVQFILEPLAIPLVGALAKMHGQRFMEQLSYINRTFAFYMHREYQKLLESLKCDPLPMPVYSDSFNYLSLVSAVPDKQPLTTSGSSSSIQCTLTHQAIISVEKINFTSFSTKTAVIYRILPSWGP